MSQADMWLIKFAEELPHRGSEKAEPKPGVCTLYAEGTRVCFVRIHLVEEAAHPVLRTLQRAVPHFHRDIAVVNAGLHYGVGDPGYRCAASGPNISSSLSFISRQAFAGPSAQVARDAQTLCRLAVALFLSDLHVTGHASGRAGHAARRWSLEYFAKFVREHREHLATIIWKDTSPQHFDFEHGYYWCGAGVTV